MNKVRNAVVGLAVAVSLFASGTAHAGFTDALEQVGRDAIQGYVGPGVTVLGAGANSGWYNSSKSLKFLMLPVGFSFVTFAQPLVSINDDMRTFDFSGDLPIGPLVPNWDAIQSAASSVPGAPTLPETMPFSVSDVPTMFGDDKAKQVTIKEFFSGADVATQNYLFMSPGGGLDAPVDSNEIVELPFVGMNFSGIAPSLPKVTMLTVGVKAIPVVNNIQVGLSYLPTLELGDFGKVGMLGLKVQHEITPHIPVVKDLPFLNLSAFWAMNSMSIEAGEASLDFSNWIMQVNGSVDAKLLVFGAGAYAGIGFEGSKMTFGVPMAQYGLPDIKDLEIKGDNKFRITLGGRLSFGIFDFFADANFGSTTLYTVGITALGLNGL